MDDPNKCKLKLLCHEHASKIVLKKALAFIQKFIVLQRGYHHARRLNRRLQYV